MSPAAGPRHYRRRATFEAMQWTGGASCLASITAWLGAECVEADPQCIALTLTVPVHGTAVARPGNWIVRSASGRLHICQPGLFEEVHELALADPPDSDLANMAAAMNAARAAANYWKKMAQNLAARLGTDLPKPPDPIPSGD